MIRFKLRLCLQLTVALTLLSEPVQLVAQDKEPDNLDRPNVLFIFLDDYGWRDCGFMGSDYYETPNLDALAKSGMIFTNAYSASANCAPARACLLSGQYTPRHEIYNVGTSRRGNPKFGKWMHVPGTDTLSEEIRTWAHQIQAAGYRTGTIGKWHLSGDPLPYGFDFNFAGTHSGSPPRGYYPPHPKAPGLKDAPSDEYLTDRLTDEAIGFIDRNRKQKWFLYLTHFAVHTPLQGKSDLV
ncbi:MAG: sulfatase-like hydrolase/transferase, partial [Rubripirellula sp.]